MGTCLLQHKSAYLEITMLPQEYSKNLATLTSKVDRLMLLMMGKVTHFEHLIVFSNSTLNNASAVYVYTSVRRKTDINEQKLNTTYFYYYQMTKTFAKNKQILRSLFF